MYFYNLNIFPEDLFSFAFFFSYKFPRVFMGEQRGSLTIAGSSLHLAQSCPLQFTHLQNGNNNEHLRKSVHISGLRSQMLGSPEAQQKEIASNFRCFEWVSNGACFSLLAVRETKFSAQASLRQALQLHARSQTLRASSFISHPATISMLNFPLSSSILLTQRFSTYAKWSRLQDEDHAQSP